MRQPAFYFTLPLLVVLAKADTTAPVQRLVDFNIGVIDSTLESSISSLIDLDNASINSVAQARGVMALMLPKAGLQAADVGSTPCVIHVVKWAVDAPGGGNGANHFTVSKSNWYVVNPKSKEQGAASGFPTNRRLYGFGDVFVLVVQLNVPKDQIDAGNFKFAYSYRTVHRLPANVQNLKDLMGVFGSSNTQNLRGVRTSASPPIGYFAIGTLSGNPPSDLFLTAAINTGSGATNLDKAEVKFDNEGLYHWDISIGAPIVSYKQLQGVAADGGQSLQANVDKRNLLALGNFFFKPVDLSDAKFLAVPHLVGGISFASKPLHSAFAGLGWGPAVANFYVGVMILTDNLPNHQLDRHYKLGFGLNLPIRSMASKLGLKSQL